MNTEWVFASIKELLLNFQLRIMVLGIGFFLSGTSLLEIYAECFVKEMKKWC